MTPHFTQPVAAIRNASQVIVGTGWLALERYIVTCAHVVDDALGRAKGTVSRPTELIAVDLPFLGKMGLRGRVDIWFPMRDLASLKDDPLADIAVLQLETAHGLALGLNGLKTDRGLPERGTPFLTFGFPLGYDNGVSASGEVLEPDAGGWLQLRDTQQFGYFVQPGFSGAPVFKSADLRLIGMTTAADGDTTKRLAFLIPSQLLCRAFPLLARPYRGLFAFAPDDTDLFFGRSRFVEELETKLKEHPFAAVIGPSGSGKSSVVLAGLGPQLKNQGWKVAVCRPSRDPLLQLGLAMAELVSPGSADFDTRNKIAEYWKERLVKDPGRIVDLARGISGNAPGLPAPLLLVIDQLEELFTNDRDSVDGVIARKSETTAESGSPRQSAYIAVLEAIAAQDDPINAPVRAIATLRADFMDQALAIGRLTKLLKDTDVKLGPMTAAELNEAIRMPARLFDVEFEDGLVEEMVATMQGRQGGLPLLQFALEQLWSHQSERKLTWLAYQGSDGKGGLESTLGEHADKVVQVLCRELGATTLSGIRRLMLRLVRLGEANGAPDARLVARRSEIGEKDWPLALRLADEHARLLTIDRDLKAEEETAEVVHEALISSWTTLRDWLDQDRVFGLWRQKQGEIIEAWAKTEDADLLLRGRRLTEALSLRETRSEDLNSKELNFINASEERAKREVEEEIRQNQARQKLEEEIAKANKRRQKEHRLILHSVVIAVAAVLLIFGTAFLTSRQNERLRTIADQYAAQAQSLLGDGHVYSAIPFAVASASMPVPARYSSKGIMEWASLHYPINAIFPDFSVLQHRLSNDGRTLATQDSSDHATLWSINPKRELRSMGPITDLLAYRKADRLLTRDKSNVVSIWRFSDGKLIARLDADHPATALWDAGSDTVFITAGRRHCSLWSVADGRLISELGSESDCKAASLYENFVVTKSRLSKGAVFDNRGNILLKLDCDFCGVSETGTFIYGISTDAISIYSALNFQLVAKASGVFQAQAIARDGSKAVVIDDSDKISLLTLSGDDKGEVKLIGEGNLPYLSPDGRMLVASGRDDSAIIIRLSDEVSMQKYPAGRFGSITYLKTKPLAIIRLNTGPLEIWDTSKLIRVYTSLNLGDVTGIVVSPDEKMMSIQSNNGNGAILDLMDMTIAQNYPNKGFDNGAQGKFSLDGSVYVSQTTDLRADLWRINNGKVSYRGMLGGNASAFEIEVSQDGSTILLVDTNYGARVIGETNMIGTRSAETLTNVCNINSGVLSEIMADINWIKQWNDFSLPVNCGNDSAQKSVWKWW